MGTLQQRYLKGLTDCAFFDRSTSPETPIPVGKPSTAELDLGIEELLFESRSQLGERVTEVVTIDAQNPVVNMTFAGLTPPLLALRLGRQLVTSEESFNVEKTIRATLNTYPAATSGREGFGMPADQAASTMSKVNLLGDYTELTRVAFASHDPAVDDTFAQGADGAFKVANNILNSDIAYSFPNTIASVLSIGEDPLTNLRLNMTVVLLDLRLFRVEIPSVTVAPAEGAIPIGAGEMSLAVRATYDGSTCTPILYKWIGQLRAC